MISKYLRAEGVEKVVLSTEGWFLTKNEKKIGYPVLVPKWAIEHRYEFARAMQRAYSRGIDAGSELQ